MKAQFFLEEQNGIVIITDLDGLRSVTNDAEEVVAYVAKRYNLAEYRIIYRDTEGRWDGLATQDGHFDGFILMGIGNREDAIRCASSRTIWK